MGEFKTENRRIAKNTVFMYIRMFVTMMVGLYTSRAVLAALGFSDYGLYNVIGGVVAMFAFINGAMTNTTSRYITFYLGKHNVTRMQQVFTIAFAIHVIIALVIILLGETAGLWYVCNKLNIPPGRFGAAMYLYQFTIITSAASIISVPFNASIIAHEKMTAFAVISIIDAFLKLGIALSIPYVPFDHLVYYALMLLVIQLMDNAIYWIYSFRNFEGIRIRRGIDWSMFKEMFGFTGWNLFGNFSYVFFTEGVNLIINFFCGTAVNAARGVAVQVEELVRQFASNVQTAINPQIIKSYAQSDLDRMFSLIFASSRYCFYLLFLLALPIMLEAGYLLSLWLGLYPEHTVNFLRITLITVSLESVTMPMFMANLASGKVKIYQITMAAISVIFIPITFLAIKWTLVPEIVFVCTLVMALTEIVARIFIVHRQVGLPKDLYVRKVICNILSVAVVAAVVPIVVHVNMEYGLVRFITVTLVSFASMLTSVYFVGLSRPERAHALSLLRSKLSRNTPQ